ncbi:MAG: threonine/serine exporter family protein [Lachnospiraceae bacterium]|nr:threonine/serine exporter family protein [Lachnospiraceae bacterium]MBQ8549305.1 threonine/serine exporter family protein [Lachnospiraceae bacterium]MBQ8845548.1 threonine/serine exporter family protein [Lachnospiraceae bacterium]
MSPLELMLQVLSAFVGVVAVAISFQVPKKYLLLAGATGAGGWLVELVMEELLQSSIVSTFLAALLVAVLAQIFARVSKAPVTLYLVTGILPLVPGVGMYRTVYYLLQSNHELTSYYLSYTLQIAGMIALAIFVVDSCFKRLYQRNKRG